MSLVFRYAPAASGVFLILKPRAAWQSFVLSYNIRLGCRNHVLLRHLPRYWLFNPAQIRQEDNLLPADRHRWIHSSQMVQKEVKALAQTGTFFPNQKKK
jgi:hypothetical protein